MGRRILYASAVTLPGSLKDCLIHVLNGRHVVQPWNAAFQIADGSGPRPEDILSLLDFDKVDLVACTQTKRDAHLGWNRDLTFGGNSRCRHRHSFHFQVYLTFLESPYYSYFPYFACNSLLTS